MREREITVPTADGAMRTFVASVYDRDALERRLERTLERPRRDLAARPGGA